MTSLKSSIAVSRTLPPSFPRGCVDLRYCMFDPIFLHFGTLKEVGKGKALNDNAINIFIFNYITQIGSVKTCL